MIYCITCKIHLAATEITKPNTCPKCSNEIREINNTKLIDLIAGLEHAAKSLNSTTLRANPKKLVEIAKIIERGEKSLGKEFAKRIDQVKLIKYEQAVIEAIAIQIGYTEKNVIVIDRDGEQVE